MYLNKMFATICFPDKNHCSILQDTVEHHPVPHQESTETWQIYENVTAREFLNKEM